MAKRTRDKFIFFLVEKYSVNMLEKIINGAREVKQAAKDGFGAMVYPSVAFIFETNIGKYGWLPMNIAMPAMAVLSLATAVKSGELIPFSIMGVGFISAQLIALAGPYYIIKGGLDAHGFDDIKPDVLKNRWFANTLEICARRNGKLQDYQRARDLAGAA